MKAEPLLDRFNNIILDFDGVILDSEPIHCEAYAVVLRKLNINLTYEMYKKSYLGLSDKDLFPKLMRDFGIEKTVDIPALILQKNALYSSIITEHKSLNPTLGFASFLNQVSTKTLAICSGATQSEISAVLQKFASFISPSIFKHIISADNVSTGKPAPEGYLLAAKRLKCRPEHCLVIEDSPPGIRAAKSAGMTVIALQTTHSPLKLQEADYLTEDFTTLLNHKFL